MTDERDCLHWQCFRSRCFIRQRLWLVTAWNHASCNGNPILAIDGDDRHQ
ncbi:hypothetical protein IQ272_10515 [Chroococcidiopsidales cyanobacterium LEGE 13417]|nr:hypothetical protein [Chroococcidiopsidales cyanobacterium LEGE 13417]